MAGAVLRPRIAVAGLLFRKRPHARRSADDDPLQPSAPGSRRAALDLRPRELSLRDDCRNRGTRGHRGPRCRHRSAAVWAGDQRPGTAHLRAGPGRDRPLDDHPAPLLSAIWLPWGFGSFARLPPLRKAKQSFATTPDQSAFRPRALASTATSMLGESPGDGRSTQTGAARDGPSFALCSVA